MIKNELRVAPKTNAEEVESGWIPLMFPRQQRGEVRMARKPAPKARCPGQATEDIPGQLPFGSRSECTPVVRQNHIRLKNI